MSYFIFIKNLDGVDNTLYRIAENESDLNNLNITQSEYKIIVDSQENFDAVKYGTKNAINYNNNIINYLNLELTFEKKEQLNNYINIFKNQIKIFTDNNLNHLLFNRWNNYYNQLNNLNLDSMTYPLNKSLEQYFKDLKLPSLHPLQLP